MNLCTGVILAGGLNKRFGGKIKAFLPLRGKRLLDYIYELFTDLFDEIILVTNDPLKYLDWDVLIGTDLFSVRSSLTGIHAGIFYASNPYCFMCASDMPFLQKNLVEGLLREIQEDTDVVIPETSEGLEPLCAVYSKRCLHRIEQQLNIENYKIRDFLKKIRLKKIKETTLKKWDSKLVSFLNINTPEDLQKANI
jgi:molybdopterin-guanine dinucleotide biosynthesis protein A